MLSDYFTTFNESASRVRNLLLCIGSTGNRFVGFSRSHYAHIKATYGNCIFYLVKTDVDRELSRNKIISNDTHSILHPRLVRDGLS